MDTGKVLDFLGDLSNNNTKEWMDENRPRYLEAKEIFLELVAYLITEMARFDETLRTVAPKDCIFRINRDIRFSKDKSPYKNNFGAFIAESGRHTPGAGYYLHLQAGGESFTGGGIYLPPNDVLAKIRQEIDYNPSELKKIVEEPAFSETFGEVQGESLKTAPKGYPKDHPNIQLLKLKSYVVLRKLGDQEVRAANFPQKLVEIFKIQKPFNDYLNVAIS